MKILILSMLSMLFTQCTKEDDLLSIPLTPYTGNQLRIDGYYYQYNEAIFDSYFFYRNGKLIECGGSKSSLEEMDKYIKECYIDCQCDNYSIFNCGVFLIEGDIIKFDRWYPSERPHKALVREGMILNDTTFRITKLYRSNNPAECWERNEIYHFRQFNPKPDSINKYVL